MPWDLTWLAFFKDFWPNFVGSVIVGIGIGWYFSGVLARKIGNELNSKERKIEFLNQKIERIQNKLEYYKIIKEDFKSNDLSAEFRLGNINTNGFPESENSFTELILWDVLLRSGEIAINFPPMTIKMLSMYYCYWEDIKKIDIEIFNTRNPYIFATDYVIETLKKKLTNILNMILKMSEALTPEIEASIKETESEIQHLQEEKEELELSKSKK